MIPESLQLGFKTELLIKTLTAKAFHYRSMRYTDYTGMDISTNSYYVCDKFAKFQVRDFKKYTNSFANDY